MQLVVHIRLQNVMTRLLLLSIVIACCGIASVHADENVRAAQTRLKEGGFFFGEISGDYTSETAAAVTRYQIRNGLQISGRLDPATAKSLDVAVAASAASAESSPAETGSDTWRRLRKSDPEFIERQNTASAASAPSIAPRAAAPTTTPSPPPPAVTTAPAPPNSGYESTLVLSPERLRDYVGAFVLAGLDRQIGSELEFFGDRVNYYDNGMVDREKIRRDLVSYAQRWPDRRFWLAGELKIDPQADSRLRVTFPLRFDLRNGEKHSTGKVIKTLLLEVTADDLEIVAVNEAKAR